MKRYIVLHLSYHLPETRDARLTSGRAEKQTVSIHLQVVWCRLTSPRGQSPIDLSNRPDFLYPREAGKEKQDIVRSIFQL